MELSKISTNSKTGEQQTQLRDELPHNPWITSSIQVVRLNPSLVDYSIERINYKTVPIIPNISIGTKEDYGLVSEVVLALFPLTASD